jgi:hypothetical protein
VQTVSAIALDGYSGVVEFRTALFESYGRDAHRPPVDGGAAPSQGFSIEPGPLKTIRAEFDAFSVTEAETKQRSPKLARSHISPTRTPPSESARRTGPKHIGKPARRSAPRIPANS